MYASWITLVASGGMSEKLALVLTEGRFTEKTVLHAADSAQAPPREAGAGAVVWDISLFGANLAGDASVPCGFSAWRAARSVSIGTAGGRQSKPHGTGSIYCWRCRARRAPSVSSPPGVSRG